MPYNKPQLTILGDAVRTIRAELKADPSVDGGSNIPADRTADPAYDLDE